MAGERAQAPGGDRAVVAAAAPASRAPARRRTARLLALSADLLQVVLLPLFGEGFASPLNDALDLVVGAALIKLVGFHWSFLPAAAAELVPGLDLAPTWTASVLLATGSGGRRWLYLSLAILGVAAALVLWRMHARV